MTTTTPDTAAPAMTVTETAIAAQLAGLVAHLPRVPSRVLDAGCGRGDLAAALTRSGYAVTAIDVDAAAVAAARDRGVPAVQADIATFTADPFDAIVFSLSLHHVKDVRAAIGQARRLLRPGARLVIDEFAWERADAATAAWFYDTATVLAVSGRFHSPPPGSPQAAGIAADPLRQWVARHRDEEPLHPGRSIIDAVGEAFDDVTVSAEPYLARYLGGRLTDDSTGAQILVTLDLIERHRIRTRSIAATGFNLVATAR